MEIGRHLPYSLLLLVSLCLAMQSACQETLRPKDFLTTPNILNPVQEYGHIATVTVIVPATANIFMAGAPDGTVLNYPPERSQDSAPENCPVLTLQEHLRGGETLDIYATGSARHIPLKSVHFDPKGWITQITAGPARNLNALNGPIGSLVGLFDNQRDPFIIGQRKQVIVPRGARSLYLAIQDYPGSSSNNEGEYLVTIDIIRR